MGGRGSRAAGNNMPLSYKTVGKINGVKVLEGINGNHSLPVEARSSTAYIKLKPDGTFHEMRIYNNERYLVTEIAYHPESSLDGSRKNVLHIHEYKIPGDFSKESRTTRLLTKHEIEKYKPFLKGVKL